MNKTIYKWCLNWRDAQAITKLDSYCFNWRCKCGCSFKYHGLYHKDAPELAQRMICDNKCVCNGFVYHNNDYCTIECQFQRKLYELD